MCASTSKAPMPFNQAWKWASFVSLLFLVNYMSRGALSPVLVSLEQDLAVSHATSTSLLLAQGIGFALSQGIAGFLVGRVAPYLVAAGCNVAAGLCLLCMYFVDSIGMARVVFFTFGILAGLYFPAGMATLSSLVRMKDWGKAVGIHELAPSLGFILVPLMAQAALIFTDWRGSFVFMGACTALSGLLFLAFGRGGRTPTSPPSFKGSAAILRNPATYGISLLLAIGMCGEFSVFSVLQLFLVNEGGFSPATANNFLSLTRVGTPVAVLLGGWAADKLPPLRIIGVGLLAHALGLICMALPHSDIIIAGASLQALSIAVFFSSVFKVLSQCFSMDQQPMVLSMTMPPAALLSAGFMPWFFGLCGEYYSFGAGFLTLAALSVLTMLSLPLLARYAR